MTANYELKKGVLLQEFGFPEKACTNNTLTDELAIWHLSRHPEKAVLFVRISPDFAPKGQPLPVPPPPPAGSGPHAAAKQIIAAEPVIIPPSKIAKEDPVERKKLIDKALALGFVSSPENKIELLSSDELKIIIPNLEKANELKGKDKEAKLLELKESLKVNKVELIKIAEEKKFPVKEWEDLNKPDLINYLFDNLSKQIE